MGEKSRPREEEQEPHTWVEGGKEEDNVRYRAFLLYCEQRRQESRIQQEEEEERKRRARARSQHWRGIADGWGRKIPQMRAGRRGRACGGEEESQVDEVMEMKQNVIGDYKDDETRQHEDDEAREEHW